MTLPTRKIGNADVTAIGYGAMGLSVAYGAPKSDEERLKVRESVSYLQLRLVACSPASRALRCSMSCTPPGAPTGTQPTSTVTTRTCSGNGASHPYLHLGTRLTITSRADRFKRTGNRGKIFLATKFGGFHGQHDRAICGEPHYVKLAIEKSLKRLGVDHVDLYYLHR